MRRLLFLFFIFTFALVRPSFVCATEISADVDKTRAAEGEEIHLTLRIQNAQGNVPAPRLPAVDGLDIFYTGRASHLTFINNRSSSSLEFNYVLVPRMSGVLTVPPIQIEADGQLFQTEPIRLEITQSGVSSRPQAPSRPAQQPFSPYTMPPPQAQAVDEPAPFHPPTGNEDVYVVAHVDKTVAYPNEQILLAYSLYTMYDTRYEGFEEKPEVSGFWIEEFPKDREIHRETVRVDGQRYLKADIEKLALFPTTAANYTIQPGTLKISIRKDPRNTSLFDEFFNDSFFSGGSFFAQRENLLLKPAPLQIQVRPFPEQGKPKSFQGAVGNFNMTAAIDKASVKQDEPVTMKIVIEGEGNIETLSKPVIPDLKDFRIYDSDASTQLFQSGDRIGGQKFFEVVFIPLAPGGQKIPRLEFTYFNPASGSYRTLSTPEFLLEVEKSTETFKLPAQMGETEAFKKEVKAEAKDIQYIHEKITGNRWQFTARALNFVFGIANSLLTVLFLLGLWKQRQEEVFSKNTGLKRRRYAKSQAEGKMRHLRAWIRNDSKGDAFFEEVEKILTQYLADKFNMSTYGITHEELQRELGSVLGASDPLYTDIMNLYRLCDESRFAKASIPKEEKLRAERILQDTIRRVERLPKNGRKSFAAWILVFLLAGGVSAWAEGEEASALFQKANQAYAQGRFDEAAGLYQRLIQESPETGDLHFNLGNAYFRQGKTGPAILSYERALLFRPRERDIRHNLRHAVNRLEYRMEDKRNWYVRAGEFVLGYFTLTEIGLLFHASYFLFMLSCVVVVFLRRGLPWGSVRKTLLILWLGSLFLGGIKGVQTHVIRGAIVTAREAEVRFGPSDTDQTAFRLGEGLKVFVVDQRDAWSRVLLTNGESGWIKNTQIEEIKI